MKRKELYAYIREEIIGELSLDEESVAWSSSTKSQAKQQIDKSKLSGDAKKQAKDEIDQNASGLISNVSEIDIDEMANIASIVKIQDADKFALAKEIYTGGRTAAVLSALEEIGDEGITPQALAGKIGVKSSNEINLILNNLRAAGVISGKRDKLVKPEKGAKEEEPEVEEPETEEPIDTWEKPEEEEPETGEEEPAAVSDKEVEKTVGTAQAQKLSPEDEDKYSKLKKGIDAKIARLKGLSAAKRASSDDMKVLKQLTNRDDVKKLFKAKGVDVKDLIADL